MAITWLDPGGSHLGGTTALSSIAGAVSAQSSTVHGQGYAYRFDTGAGPANCSAKTGLGAITASGRLSAYFLMDSWPAAGGAMRPIGITPTASNTTTLALFVSNAGVLSLRSNSSSTTLKTGTVALQTGRWYRLSISYTIATTTSWSCNAYIDGVLELSATNADGTLSSAAPVDLFSGIGTGAGANVVYYLSDWYADDTADLTDTGDIRVTAKLPTTNTTNGFDTNVGTQAVNERPVSTSNGKTHAGTSDVDQDYDIQDPATGDASLVGATIVGYVGWIYATLSSLTGTPASNIILAGARTGTVWDPAVAGTAQLFRVTVTSSAYPRHATNGKNIGSSSSTIAADTSLYECGVVIAYIPDRTELTGRPFGRLGAGQMHQLLAQ